MEKSTGHTSREDGWPKIGQCGREFVGHQFAGTKASKGTPLKSGVESVPGIRGSALSYRNWGDGRLAGLAQLQLGRRHVSDGGSIG